ncbi:MAG: hypothetical protein VYC18_08855 [Pseudomonadota bacterium]|nr:hypothetical protein [Pseudomonadota bacterium]
MFGDKQDIGLMFYSLPRLLIDASNLIKSESDYLLKCARLITGKDTYTHDQQLFRNIRAGTSTVDDVVSFFTHLPLKKKPDFSWQPKYQKGDIVGDWLVIRSWVSGFRHALGEEDKDIKDILLFIEEHCEAERAFLSECNKRLSKEAPYQYASVWLNINQEILGENSLKSDITFLARITLYWCIILEKIASTWIHQENPKLLKSIMPTLVKERAEFSHSNEKLLFKFKQEYERIHHGGQTKPWTHFYKHIAVMKQQDDEVGKGLIEDTVDPDVGAIKKQVQRWRADSLFTFDAFRKHLLISYYSFNDSKKELEAFLIYLISNCLTSVQMTLVKRCDKRVDTEHLIAYLEDEFSKVEEVRDLVEKRFQHYVKNGTLQP